MSQIERCSQFSKTKGECPMNAKQLGMCKSHYNSYLNKGPKEFARQQFLNRKMFELREFRKKVKEDPRLQMEYDVLEFRFKIEHKELHDSLEFMPDHKNDIKFQKAVDKKIRISEIKYLEKVLKHEMKIALDLITENTQLQVAIEVQLDLTERFKRLESKCETNDEIYKYCSQFVDNFVELEHRIERIHERIKNQGELARFVEDKQNVHLTPTVDMVVRTYRLILDMEKDIPEEYKWSRKMVSKTPGEIIAMCNLSPRTCGFMMSKYLMPNQVYGIDHAYARILDAVWNFIKNHEDKEMLMKTLRQELTDNVDMCEQGNLTRLCNVLSGYIEGIEVRSLNEQLGDLLGELYSETDEVVRIEKAKDVLRSLNVPDSEWDTWIDPLKN